MANEVNTQANADAARRQMKGRVILIINGLNERGRILAGKLSEQGADVAIAGSGAESEWIPRIQQVVNNNSRSCLILIPTLFSRKREEPFSHHAIQKIIETFCRLDAFITYADTDVKESNQLTSTENKQKPEPTLFDQYRLSQAAMKQILAQ